MDSDLPQKAIAAALAANWKEAIKFNLAVLRENSKDIDSLNRLARAYAESGNIKKAKSVSEKVIRLDPFNAIAVRCLNKWKGIKSGGSFESSNPPSLDTFLEEPGRTKLVNLLHPGALNILANLDSGDEVKLIPHAHRVNVVSRDLRYIGRLPDDLSARLRKLMKLGNQYKVLIKSIDKGDIKIFIREVLRGDGVASQSSFPTEKIDYVSFTPPELVHPHTNVEDPTEADNEI